MIMTCPNCLSTAVFAKFRCIESPLYCKDCKHEWENPRFSKKATEKHKHHPLVVAVVWRYRVVGKQEYETLKEAMRNAFFCEEANTAYFESITDYTEGKAKVYDRKKILKYFELYSKDWTN